MGFLDRLGKVASGLGGALHAPVGLIYDFARAPFVDEEELDGFVNVLYGRTVNRGGEAFSNLLGPEEGVGAIAGALPEFARAPIRSITTPVLAGLETAGREAIREPLTALMSAASLAEAGEGFDLKAGYKIAQDRSLGQAVALAFLTDDITDEAEVAKAMGSDWYDAISGTTDGLARLFMDVDVLAGGVLMKARKAGVASRTARIAGAIPGADRLTEAGIFGRSIRTTADVEAALRHPSLGKINERILGIRREAGVEVGLEDLPEIVPLDEALRQRATQAAVPEAPAEPGIVQLLENPPPAAEGLPPLFHGTKAAIPDDALDTTLRFDAQSGNLFGTGFYTTAAEDVASSYQKKGATRARPGDEPTVYSVQWKGERPPNVLDLDQPALPEVGSIFQRIVDEARVADEFALEDLARWDELIAGGGSTADIYLQFRTMLAHAGAAMETADDIITDVNWAIRDELGYDAFKHTGGIYAAKGKGQTHDVYIWLDPGNVQIVQRSRGPSREAVDAYRQAVTEHGALSEEATAARRALEVEEQRVIKETQARETVVKERQEVARRRRTDVAAAQIRDLAFHDHRDGGYIAGVLAEADDLTTAWGALMGHRPSMATLYQSQPEIAGRISRLSGDQARIAEFKRAYGGGQDQLPFDMPDDLKTIERSQLDAEIDALYDIEAKLSHDAMANATVRELPRISRASEARHAATRSEFFQKSHLAAPLRLAINMRPRNMVDLHDAAGDVQVTRMLKKAKVDLPDQDRLRGAYMAAADPTARNRVLAEAESTAIAAIARRRGITDPDQIKRLTDAADTHRGVATATISKSRVYDGKGRAYIEDVDADGSVNRVYLPISATQEFNHFITADLDAIDSIFKEANEKAARWRKPTTTVINGSTEMLQKFQNIWKPSVLMRVGWPVRVVGEEQLRIMSQIGALVTVGRTARAGGRYVADVAEESVKRTSEAVRRIPVESRTYRDPATRGLRLGTRNVRGWEMENAYGTPATFNDVYRNLVSARGSFEPIIRDADSLRASLRNEVTGEWHHIEPSDLKSWGPAWSHAVNNQMGKDPMWRQFVEGKTVDEVRAWIDETVEGRAYLRDRVPHWKHQVDDWLEVAKQTADDYLPTEELRSLALEGKARMRHMEKTIPDAAGRPNVHGALLTSVTGKTKAAQAIGGLRDKAMHYLGTLPTDVLSRNNYFDYHYTNEVDRLVRLADEQGVSFTPDVARQMEAKARNYALGESRKLLFDLAEQSELAHMLRFVSPFASAWQEVLTRWTGIAVDNPAFVERMREVWNAPERAGLIQDEDGNRINADGTATSPLGEKVEPGQEKFLNFALLPEAVKDFVEHIPGVRTDVKVNKEGFNMILQGMPGVGPVVQIPMNQIAKDRPELEDSLRWALPFGATQSTMDMLLPATARRLKTKAGGEEDRLYANQLMRIHWDAQVDYSLGKRADPPTYAEAKKKTDDFYNLRTVASFISPVAPSFTSPYQIQIDAYRALKEKDPATADEIFLRDYGPEFFPLTQSLSKSMDGIPPTLEGATARRKYADLVEKHPDLGGLIVGSEGAGEFSSAVYQSQLQNKLRPGSPYRQRETFAFEEAQAKPNERLGWIEYGQAMDTIEAERINRGLPNLSVKSASDLAALKRQVTEAIATRYPEWYAAFSSGDRNAWNRRLAGLTEIAADDRLAGRAEIAGLREYLSARDVFVNELRTRDAAGGAKTITAAANADLAGLWEQVKGRLVEGNLQFQSVYYRWLERDPLEVT